MALVEVDGLFYKEDGTRWYAKHNLLFEKNYINSTDKIKDDRESSQGVGIFFKKIVEAEKIHGLMSDHGNITENTCVVVGESAKDCADKLNYSEMVDEPEYYEALLFNGFLYELGSGVVIIE